MKRKVLKVILAIFIVISLAVCICYYSYSQVINNVAIIQYFNSKADNLDYQAVRIRAIVPEDSYQEDKTMNVIRIYVIIRCKNMPNSIDIILYGDMEKLSHCESYAEVSFESRAMFR